MNSFACLVLRRKIFVRILLSKSWKYIQLKSKVEEKAVSFGTLSAIMVTRHLDQTKQVGPKTKILLCCKQDL